MSSRPLSFQNLIIFTVSYYFITKKNGHNKELAHMKDKVEKGLLVSLQCKAMQSHILQRDFQQISSRQVISISYLPTINFSQFFSFKAIGFIGDFFWCFHGDMMDFNNQSVVGLRLCRNGQSAMIIFLLKPHHFLTN